MIAIIYSVLWIIASFKLGDRNWKPYYPTILYAALGNALYELLCYKYHLWNMEPNGVSYAMIPILLLTLVGMPLSTWVYLSRYPSGKRLFPQALYIAVFTAIFIVLEYVAVVFGSITYHNHWKLLWSFLFVIAMFVMLRLHYLRPLLALLLSVPIALLLCFLFGVTLDQMK